MSGRQRILYFSPDKLISISEAAKFAPYSAEYLSLLARKGQLKAIKISRDWLTTRRAVLDYVHKQKLKHQKIIADFDYAERAQK